MWALIISVMQHISKGKTRRWSKTEGRPYQSCHLHRDSDRKLISQGPFEGGVIENVGSWSQPYMLAAHRSCHDRVLIRECLPAIVFQGRGVADESLRAEKAIYQESKRETNWFTNICEKMVNMDASDQCAGCYLQEESLPRRGYKFTVQSNKKGSVAWLEESCFLAEAERLGLYDPSTKTTQHARRTLISTISLLRPRQSSPASTSSHIVHMALFCGSLL